MSVPWHVQRMAALDFEASDKDPHTARARGPATGPPRRRLRPQHRRNRIGRHLAGPARDPHAARQANRRGGHVVTQSLIRRLQLWALETTLPASGTHRGRPDGALVDTRFVRCGRCGVESAATVHGTQLRCAEGHLVPAGGAS